MAANTYRYEFLAPNTYRYLGQRDATVGLELPNPTSVRAGRCVANFDLEYRTNIVQANFSEIFARCARRQIIDQISRNPCRGQQRRESDRNEER